MHLNAAHNLYYQRRGIYTKAPKTSVDRNYSTYRLVIPRREEYGLCTTGHSIIIPSISRFSSRV